MRVPATAVEGVFLRRANRFRAEVRIGRKVSAVHVPNSGRLGELLFPGNRVLLLPVAGPNRKTRYDLLLAGRPDGRGWVCVDARNPNRLVKEAVEDGVLPGFETYSIAVPEPRIPAGRLDFLFEGNGIPPCLVETKCVTLVENGVALFPDAPTPRGTKHLRYLTERVRRGDRAAILFVVARSDAISFSANDENDAEFSQALREAVGWGVTVKALTCRITRRELRLMDSIPIRMEGSG